jgi:hypothetical protein
LKKEDDKTLDRREREREKLDQLKKFFQSPFKEDRKFAIEYLSKYTRDSL